MGKKLAVTLAVTLAALLLAALGCAPGEHRGASTSAAAASPPHSVTLNWKATLGSSGYNVYRADVSRGDYKRLNQSPVTKPTYTDESVTAGATYYYVVTSVDRSGKESGYSTEMKVMVPK